MTYHDFIQSGEMKEANNDEVKLLDGEILKIKFDRESSTRTKLEILLYNSARKYPSKNPITASSTGKINFSPISNVKRC